MEKELHGGRDGKIFQKENAVIRPMNPWTKSVHHFLAFLEQQQVSFVPKPLQITAENESVSFMPGEVFNDPLPDFFYTDEMIVSAAKLLRNFHDVGENYLQLLTGNEQWMLQTKGTIDVMCHGDFAPYNVTIIDHLAANIIDFDTLHPGSRLKDIAYALYRWCPLYSPEFTEISLEKQIQRSKLFLKNYGLDKKVYVELPDIIVERLEELVAYMRQQASQNNADFQKNIAAGHLQQYETDIQYLTKNRSAFIAGWA